MKIIVYVRSNTIVMGTPKHRTTSPYANSCVQRDTYVLSDSIEQRLLEPESMEIVQAAKRWQENAANNVQFVDVGFARGRLQAWLSGVLAVPTVVMDGVKYRGFMEARRALAQETPGTSPGFALPAHRIR